MALRTRSRLSRTQESGSPTSEKVGSPNDTSTSTCTRDASTPKIVADHNRASMVDAIARIAPPSSERVRSVTLTSWAGCRRNLPRLPARSVQKLRPVR